MSTNTCGKCKFYGPDKRPGWAEQGVCRRHAPSPLILGRPDDYQYEEHEAWPTWPKVLDDECCGEFTSKRAAR